MSLITSLLDRFNTGLIRAMTTPMLERSLENLDKAIILVAEELSRRHSSHLDVRVPSDNVIHLLKGEAGFVSFCGVTEGEGTRSTLRPTCLDCISAFERSS